MSTTVDSVVAAYRHEITALDEQLLETVNARIAKVAELRRYKTANGLAFIDPGREAALVEHLKRLNDGPLSDRGVDELIRFVLELVKHEVADD